MVTDASEESGLEELLRLSQKIRDMGREQVEKLEHARAGVARIGKRQVLQDLIREIEASVVLDKLDPLATFKIIETVENVRKSQDTTELRKLILDLVNELLTKVDRKNDDSFDARSVERSLKTVGILLELLFYYE
jgi:signal recognition particle GTPase